MRDWLAAIAGLVFTVSLAGSALATPTLLFDVEDGKVLYAEDIDNQWHPASVTKMMTAYLVFEAIKAGDLRLDDKIICSEKAHKQQPSKIGLPIGAELSVETGLKALIIKSANDVAVMLAEAVGGTEEAFVRKMNATAKRLGMTRTNFVNPNGLPADEQVTTARDLAKLTRAVVEEYPEYAEMWKSPMMRLGKIRLGSHNRLLRTFEGADGMKTGFICDSGFNVVASATRDGRRLMAVVLGLPTARDRNRRAALLLEYGFVNYEWKTLFNAPTLDKLPVADNPKDVVSIRETVPAYGCKSRVKSALAKKRIKARKEKRAKAAAERRAKQRAAASGKSP